MKKFFASVSLVLVLGILGGCGPSPQEQYKEELKSQAKMNDQTFKITIDSLSINSSEEQNAEDKMTYDVVEKQLKGLSLKGTILKDKKTKDVVLTLSTNLFGQDLDYEVFTSNKTKDYYIKADAYNQTIEFIKQFTTELPVDVIDSKVIQGKYIHLTKEELDESLDEANEVRSISSKQYSDFYDSLDKDSFKKEGDKITHQFTKKELESFVDSLSEKKDKELRTSIEERLEELKKLTIDLTVDTKKKTKKAKFVATTKPVDGISYTLKMSIDQRAKDSEKRVKLPSKKDSLSLTEFAREAVSLTDVEVSEEDMQTLLEKIRQNSESVDAETAERFKETYKHLLSDEQFKELSKVLDEIVAENSQV
ncbi:hypothetical protein [Candidatus Enterococcus murrayae]|uniref:DUF5105 domain-containing protein n=1 Tax=Candidatus Enterococcus murrayae TaxID=2815321 RepID=A0ABS3HE40_9ENTE|nr:hypothetical protein [Enterococcus sp. MJM16]MBO0451170.1 hypothetical protein [Enterococcus sp. MJM16]